MKEKKNKKQKPQIRDSSQDSSSNYKTKKILKSEQKCCTNDDEDDQQYKIQRSYLPPRLHKQKNYRKYDQKGIRRVKTVACECLKQMKLKYLYNFWAKKTEGERNKRYIILLVIMIVAKQDINLAQIFVDKYKNMCKQIIKGKHQKFKNDSNSPHFNSIKYNLNLSMKAAQSFIQSKFDIDSGLKIMQNSDQHDYYLQSKKKLLQYQFLISQNRHKKNKKQKN